MSLTYQTPSTVAFSAASPSTISVNYPATVNAGDLLVVAIGMKPNTATITTPSGWTAPTNGSATGGTGSVGADTGPMKAAMFYKVAAGTESGTLSITLSGSPNVAGAWMYRVVATSGVYDIVCSSGSDNSGGSSWSVTGGTSTDWAVNDIMLNVAAIPTDASNGSWTSENVGIGSGSLNFDLSSTPYGETTTGNDMAVRGTPMTCDGAVASAAPAHTASVPTTNTNVAGPEIFMRVRESTAADQTVSPVGFTDNPVGNPAVTLAITPVAIPTDNSVGPALVSRAVSTVGFSDEIVGNPAVSSTYTASPASVKSSETVGYPSITIVTSINPVGIPSSDQPGSPSVSTSYTVSPTAVPSSETASSPSVTPVLSPVGISTQGTNGNPNISSVVSPVGFQDEVLGSPAVSTTYSVSPYGISTTNQPGNPAVQLVQTVSPSSIPQSEVVGLPALSTTYTVSPTGFTDGSIGNPNISRVLAPTSLPTSEKLGNPTLSVVVGINPVGITPAEQLGLPSVSTTVTVTPTGIPSAQSLGNPAVATILTLNPTATPSQEAVGAPTVSTSTSVTPTGIPTSQAVSGGSISGLNTVSVSGMVSGERFGVVGISKTYTLSPAGIGSESAVGNLTLQFNQIVSASGISSDVLFGSTVITTIPLDLKPIVVYGSSDYTVSSGSEVIQVTKGPQTVGVGVGTTPATSNDVITVYKDP